MSISTNTTKGNSTDGFIETIVETTEDTWEEVAQGVGIIRPKSALLWRCPKCDTWNVSTHKNSTLDRTLQLGSRVAKFTVQKQQPCKGCGAHGMRLHSTQQSRIIAQVDARKRKQVLNLNAVAEELNALQDDTGEPATEYDANKAWFSMNKLLKQGKGRKWWGMPFRRWAKTLEQGRCL